MKVYAIVFALLGIGVILIGRSVFKGKTQLIHDYHRTNVKKELLEAYGRDFGKALFVLGGAIFLNGVICLFGESTPVLAAAFSVLGVGLVMSLIMIIRAQKKYNGGIFGI